MPIEWTGSDPELSLRLDRALGEPLRVQLERALRQSIQSGRLEAGERIPSTRRLAVELGISRGLVVDCYAQLEAEGYLSSRPGSATRVAEGAGRAPVQRSEVAPLLLPLPPGGIDFRPIQPDLSSFPLVLSATRLAVGVGRGRPPCTQLRVRLRRSTGGAAGCGRWSPATSAGCAEPSPSRS